MKHIMTQLRELGYTSIIYINDILLIEKSKQQCQQNVEQTQYLLKKIRIYYTSRH